MYKYVQYARQALDLEEQEQEQEQEPNMNAEREGHRPERLIVSKQLLVNESNESMSK